MNAETFEVILKALPYPQQISKIQEDGSSIQFTWRGITFRVSESLMVEEVGDGVLIGSNSSIILSALLKSVKHGPVAIHL